MEIIVIIDTEIKFLYWNVNDSILMASCFTELSVQKTEGGAPVGRVRE